MTQLEEIARHLEETGRITSYEAFSEYGVTRLSAIIFKLKAKGYCIQTEIMNSVNRYGRKVHFTNIDSFVTPHPSAALTPPLAVS